MDTSVWVDHLSQKDAYLQVLLGAERVLCHPFIIGEVALGNLSHRKVVLGDLLDLPQATVAHDEEVLQFIDQSALFGSGVGYVDAHLLAAVKMMPGTLLWTRDKRLLKAAAKLQLAFELIH